MMRHGAGLAPPARWTAGGRSLGRVLALVGWVGLAAPAVAPAQSDANGKVYFDASHQGDALLRNAENLVRAGSYAEAIEIYGRVMQQFGDKVVELPAASGAESRLSINARSESQRRIAALPPEARALYRDRVDPQAELWYRQGLADRDRALLRRVVDQAFCSSWGDDALDLLGDLAFQEGQFAEALGAYTQLLPERASEGASLVHPDPSVDMGRVAAKKLLCRVAIGEHPPTTAELAEFARAHPPQGDTAFAGRQGPLAINLIEAVQADRLGPPPQADGRWLTFAGAPTRDRIVAGPIDVGSLQWRASLEPVVPSKGSNSRMRGMGFTPGPISPDRLLAYQPIIVDDQVLVADEGRIAAFDLNNRRGEASGGGVAQAEPAWRTMQLAIPTPSNRLPSGVPRFTLTAVGSRVFARMGSAPGLTIAFNRMGMGGQPPTTPSSIVAIDRSSDGKLLWKRDASEIGLPKRPNQATSGHACFEGSPVADGRSVYVGLTDRAEMTACYVVCLDAETGAPRWIRYICEANGGFDPFSSNPEVAHRLLSQDGPTLYYQTNLGALAALDAETGAVRWLATYPWAGRSAALGGMNGFGMGMGMGFNPNAPPAQLRDLNPAVVHDGLVIIAPDEAPHLFAFDAATGRLAWKSEPIPEEVRLAHVLGVAKGYVIATGDRVLWFDVRTGKLAHAWPEKSQATQGFGRGLLAGDRVYWPTRGEIHVLDQATGLRSDMIRLAETYGVEGGNLVAGDGYLVVAQANGLAVFCQNSRLIERYRDEIARAPEDPLNYFRLAQAAEAIGRDEEALASLDQALPRAGGLATVDGQPLAEATRDHRRRILMKLGERSRLARDWAEAARRFEQAADAATVDRHRLAARLELAEVRAGSGDAPGAVRVWQGLLGDESLRALTVEAPDGHRTVRADLMIVDRLAALLRARGRDAYAEFDRAAEGLLALARDRQDPRLLEDLGRAYPAARVGADAAALLGQIYARLGRPGDSARAFKRLLAVAPDDATRARAWWGLGEAFEAQRLWVPARSAFLQAASLEPARGAPAADRLGRPPFDRLLAEGAAPPLGLPLRRRWDRRWGEPSGLIVASGTVPSSEVSRLFLTQGGAIRPVDPATGASPWSRDLGGKAAWVGFLADRLLAATPSRLAALALADGAPAWQFDLGAEAGDRAADPFARAPEPGATGREAGTGPLSGFTIVGNRVFCLRGDRTLLAFDGDTGQLDWSYSTPAASRINPRFHVGPGRIVLQVRHPNGLLVLDTATGRPRGEFARPDEEPWLRDPLPVDDDHVAVVTDRRSVALLDLDRGVAAWVFRESDELPINGPPRLLGDGDALFVLQDGRELIRLDPGTGAKRWSRQLGPEDLSERPEAIAVGADAVAVAADATLTVLRAADGGIAWKRPLIGPRASWVVALTDRAVAAWPNLERVRDYAGPSFPLVFHRRGDGELVQRLQFPADTTDLAVRFSGRGALVATSQGVWALGDRPGMDEGRPGR